MKLVRYIIASAPNREGPYIGLVSAAAGASLIGSIFLTFGIAFTLFGEPTLETLTLSPLLYVGTAIVSFLVVATCAVFIGVPYSWLLSRLRLEGAISYAVGGGALGTFPMWPGVAQSDLDWIVQIG